MWELLWLHHVRSRWVSCITFAIRLLGALDSQQVLLLYPQLTVVQIAQEQNGKTETGVVHICSLSSVVELDARGDLRRAEAILNKCSLQGSVRGAIKKNVSAT